ncbi:MAG TPA: Asp-tRNA(Asn)/Glu-tRNA(Gln) amidotransferase subunit GatB [Chloroflexota bacterium]|jgi:aspartyl-tRNA(Asn)/glutamyl-tRNA(Gln) amidotransferase subunit B|nr:Asp-tRNA(Asn)/Glu-tRNA(Gln) amidotransferase subunit GatB [Chloroflexota bacterium]
MKVLAPEMYEVVIGLEVHAELLTQSKMFCGCANQPNATPNSNVCPVCLGLPGALPVINQRAVELTALTGLALNCSISEFTRFDRKNYFYPDLMKGYQISQYQHPIAHDGWIEIEYDGRIQRIGIRRVHLEEDTAKLFHRVDPTTGRPYSLVDVNRGGVPLIEIVSEPDIHSAEQARLYLQALRTIVQYLGVSTGNMEEGSFRCDANVSVRPVGSTELGTKVEVKNMNSFRAVFRALEYEAERQIKAIANGEPLTQETRGWDESRGITVGQRSKESAHDYRYFPEPDLPPLSLAPSWVASIRQQMPELPAARRQRFETQYGLSPYDAEVLTTTRATADYYEATVKLFDRPKQVANWLTGELFRLLNASNLEIGQSKVSPAGVADLLQLIEKGVISGRAAKDVFEEMFRTGESANRIIEAKGLTQISDAAALDRLVDEAIAANPKSVADYKSGKAQAIGFLVGQVMKASRGKANPGVVNDLLRAKLDQTG